MPTDQEYYGDFTQWGNYQYVTLQEVINDIMATIQDDEFISIVPRRTLLHHARRQLQELTFDAAKEIKAIELEINPQTLFVTLPPDFVNYIRISWVDQNGILHPMAENSNLSLASSYLQDNNYELLFDENGYILEGSGRRQRTPNPATINTESSISGSAYPYGYYYSFAPNVDASQVYPNGMYRLDRPNGVIEFSSDVASRIVVIEYISDGLYFSPGDDRINSDANIRIHKFGREALYYGILTRLTETRRNVPLSRVRDFRDQYKRSFRLFKRRTNTLRKDELLQYFRHDGMWVKGLQLSF